MKNVIGTIDSLVRMDNSINGNPRFKVIVNGETFYTAPDSMIGYSIQNYAHRPIQISLTAKMYYGKMTIQSIEKV